MEMALGLILGLFVGKSEKRARLLYVAAALPVVIALVLANSRGGILSMFSQVLFLLLMYGRFGAAGSSEDRENGIGERIWNVAGKLPVRVLLIACLLGAMVVGVLWIGGEPLTKRLETLQGEVSNEDADTGEGGRREEIWRASWKIFKAHPVTGIGFGGYWVAITEYYDVPGHKRPYQAHNDYLDLLVSGGLIGTLIGFWFVIALVKRVRTTLQTKDSFRRSACLAALTGLFGIAVHSIVDFGLHITINALVCVALIVIATVDERVEEAWRPRLNFQTRSP
jgi:O-antigen ligase